MTALMSQTLSNKEAVIKALEHELKSEMVKNQDISSNYKDEIKEIELDKKAIQDLKAKSDKIERQRAKKEVEELKKENELDMVPTREKGPKKLPKKYQLKDHPIFFKNSKIKSQIPKSQSL